VVAIVSADVPDALAILAGLKEHVAPLGNPLHDRVTVLLKPKFDIATIAAFAELPAVTGDGDNALTERSNPDGVVFSSTPVPITDGEKYGPSDTTAGHGKTKSGRPSPFISAMIGRYGMEVPGKKPLAGTLNTGPNVPSPSPNATPPCELPDLVVETTRMSARPSPFTSPSPITE